MFSLKLLVLSYIEKNMLHFNKYLFEHYLQLNIYINKYLLEKKVLN